MTWSGVVVNAHNVVNRAYHATAVLKEKLLTFGGMDGCQGVLGEVVVTTLTSEGIKCSAFNEPSCALKGLTASSMGSKFDKVLIFGGCSAEGKLSSDVFVLKEPNVESCDTSEGTMSLQAVRTDGDSPPPRAFHTASVAGANRQYLIIHGGKNSNSQLLNDIWVLDCTTLLERPDSAAPEAAPAKGKLLKGQKSASMTVPQPVWSSVSFQSPIEARCLHGCTATEGGGNGFKLFIFGGVGEEGPLTLDTLELGVATDGTGMFSAASSSLIPRGTAGVPSDSRCYSFSACEVLEKSNPAVVMVFGGSESCSMVLVLDTESSAASDLVAALPSTASTASLPSDTTVHIEYSNGDVYDGEVIPATEDKEAVRQGRGKMTFADGTVYEGEWVEDRQEGNGTLTSADGDTVYEGGFVGGEYEGEGSLSSSFDVAEKNSVHRNSIQYKGGFKNGVYHGRGVLTNALSGTTYEGEFSEGKRHGRGTLRRTEDDAVEYDGEWATDVPCGIGTMVLDGGGIYTGQIQGGVPEGQGVCKYPDGGEYDGAWKGGKRNGQGRHIAGTLDEYTGKWVGDMRSGRGVWQSRRGDKYEGLWDRNLPHGTGTMTYNIGDSCTDASREREYTGGWSHGKRQGSGQVTYADGSVRTGSWKSDGFDDALTECSTCQ
eukprot:CAMPEP_0185034708 /NCGR_PEP_ID=MMETSP1103-20130426/24814_1 /TAXON_ID=36769 /ORGANISM="Paraphysomonas bandaiensis, Strain Caron Lab Isolate" /LENGTH=656 /DNA_ID=CAMNT_0027571469 /DNA_START=198 /DNA_END=2168 /DNA_ORIENTATION=+